MGTFLPVITASLALAGPAEIAYTSDTGLFSVKADGTAPTPLAQAPKGEFLDEPVWSPDGARLVYTQGDEDSGRLMLKDATGVRPVTAPPKDASDGAPAWSPDGTRLVFSRFISTDESITTQILVRDLAASTERAVVTQKWDRRGSTVGAPTFAPDGATVAFTLSSFDRNVDGLSEIRTVPAGGGPARTFIKRAQLLTYSPDGTRVAYASIADHNGKRCGSDECFWAGELYVANADGTQPRRLTQDEGDIGFPRWSPDSSRILFSSDRNLPDAGSDELYTIAPDGSCLTWLTNGVSTATRPAWRPGSGDTFTADCDPDKRPVAYTPPKTKKYTGNLWLGNKYKGLLLTRVYAGELYYRDCERFTGCLANVRVGAGSYCDRKSGTPRLKLSVRRGWLVGTDFESQWVVFAGTWATFASPAVVDDLKVRRRETPRIPRALLAQLGAAQKAKLKPYRTC